MINSAIPQPDKQKFLKKWLLIMGFFILIIFLWSVFAPFGIINIFLLNKEKTRLVVLNNSKAKEINQLKYQVDGLKDPSARENILREELGWAKDKDFVYIFPDKENKEKK
jgi:cell division protein FtsB